MWPQVAELLNVEPEGYRDKPRPLQAGVEGALLVQVASSADVCGSSATTNSPALAAMATSRFRTRAVRIIVARGRDALPGDKAFAQACRQAQDRHPVNNAASVLTQPSPSHGCHA